MSCLYPRGTPAPALANQPMIRLGFQFSIVLCVLCLASCAAKETRKPVYPAHGKILDRNQKPAVGAFIVFHPVIDDGDQNKPYGKVQDDGTFALTTYQEGDGAPEGEYVATITWHGPGGKSPFNPGASGPDKLRGHYSVVKESKLRYKIEKKDDNVLAPITLQ